VPGDDEPAWRPDQFGYGMFGCATGIHFPIVKLVAYSSHAEQLEADLNPLATVVLAHLKTQETRADPAARRTLSERTGGAIVSSLPQSGYASSPPISASRAHRTASAQSRRHEDCRHFRGERAGRRIRLLARDRVGRNRRPPGRIKRSSLVPGRCLMEPGPALH
jgi:hypothetical protein